MAVSHQEVGQICMALPGAFEQPSYGGRPSWRTKARMFTWIREDPEALVVWVESIGEKEALINSAPTRFFTIDHYDRHPIVLVDLAEIDQDEVAELITESWRQRAPKTLVKEWDADHPPVE